MQHPSKAENNPTAVRALDLTGCGEKTIVSHLFFEGSDFFWCTRGEFRFEFSDRPPVILRQGEFIVIFPHRFVTIIGLAKKNDLHGGVLIGSGSEETLLRLGFWDCFVCEDACSAENLGHLKNLILQQMTGDVHAELATRNYVSSLLQGVMVAQGYGREALFYEAVRLINANFLDGNVSIKALYKQLNCSPTSVIRQFKAHGLESPSEYLHRLQTRRACQQLCRSRLTIEEIANACGFSGNSSFSRFFRDRLGLSPADVRNGAPYTQP